MKKLTDEQIQVMTIAEQSLPKLKALAERARKANLNVLRAVLETIEFELKLSIENQARAFRDNSLINPEGRFP